MSSKSSSETISSVSFNRRLESIDVLRGIAVIAVLLLHFQNSWYYGVGGDVAAIDRPRMRDHWLGITMFPLSLGSLGVNIFFLLSGFCIHSWWLARKRDTQRFPYQEYFKRRLIRLYPAYFGAIVLSLVLLGLTEWIRAKFFGFGEPSHYASNILAQTIRYLTFSHTLSTNTFGGYNAPLYTMAIEFQFYLAYPALLYLFRKFGEGKTFLGATTFSIVLTTIVLASGDPKLERLVLDSLLVRWPEWILGAILAHLWLSESAVNLSRLFLSKRAIVLAIVSFLIGFVVQNTSNVSLNLLWTLSLAPIVTGVICNSSRFLHMSVWRFLSRVGMFSYSLYLIHAPILRLGAVLFPPSDSAVERNFIIFLFLMVGIFLLAKGFYLVMEKPFLKKHEPLTMRN